MAATVTVNPPLEVGFLGTGYIADWHAEALRAVRGVRLVAACDRDLGRVRAFAARHGVARVAGSLEELLDGGRLDAIHVLLPPDAHARAAAAILQAGIAVLLEKPMATSIADCEGLITRAEAQGVTLGVSHNFLFAPVYQRLRDDLRAGRLGRLDEVTITWHKGLDQLQAGPFDLWMLRRPGNILLEIGPHPVAHLLDLVGPAEIRAVHASNPLDLPGGARFYRRWHVEAEAGAAATAVTLSFSFATGFAEQSIRVRGSLASATVDFERNTYLLHRHTPLTMDFDRYRMTVTEANALKRQARRTLGQVALGKVNPSFGKPYNQTLARALQAFYSQRLAGATATATATATAIDARLAPELGRDVVRTCLEIVRRSGVEVEGAGPAAASPAAVAATAATGPGDRPEILVLGATGFIGRELARQLAARGHSLRVLVR
ncbi:MAG TPA: Gfo/Idh/MocA family oxidoreductase, partial [Isosphaeraceae bacterium]|nr:Gfo/Idh/MocA family oxidoreductase [Isosphaeraceae bacterium]